MASIFLSYEFLRLESKRQVKIERTRKLLIKYFELYDYDIISPLGFRFICSCRFLSLLPLYWLPLFCLFFSLPSPDIYNNNNSHINIHNNYYCYFIRCINELRKLNEKSDKGFLITHSHGTLSFLQRSSTHRHTSTYACTHAIRTEIQSTDELNNNIESINYGLFNIF